MEFDLLLKHLLESPTERRCWILTLRQTRVHLMPPIEGLPSQILASLLMGHFFRRPNLGLHRSTLDYPRIAPHRQGAPEGLLLGP